MNVCHGKVVIIEQKSIINMNQFNGTIWAKYNTMEQACQNNDFDLKGEEILMKKTDNAIKPNKCNQCNFASFHARSLKVHLKIHSGEKSMQPMWLCLFSGRQFEETFENSQWGKDQQMQPM